MTTDSRFEEFEALASDASPDEWGLSCLAFELAAGVDGQERLARRYADSSNVFLLRYSVFPLADLIWHADSLERRRLNASFMTFLKGAANSQDAATVQALQNALTGLLATSSLEAQSEGQSGAFGTFVRSNLGVDSSPIAKMGALEHLSRIWSNGLVQSIFADVDLQAIVRDVRRIERDESAEFGEELGELRPFLDHHSAS